MRYQILQILFVLLGPSLSFAESGGFLLESRFFDTGNNYLEKLKDLPTDKIEELNPDQQSRCRSRYNKVLRKDVLDIRIALGYFDWTTGSPVVDNGVNYGLSPSVDIGAYWALRDILTTPCETNIQFCGFKNDSGNPNIFLKRASIRGRNITVRIEVRYSSASESFNDNTGALKKNQMQQSQMMETYYANALQNADAVFYYGHSRNGGGPDFLPPVLIPGQNRVNYDGYYRVHQPGFRKMIQALTQGVGQAPVLALMSCDSRDHFLNTLRSVAPGSGVITSTAVTQWDQVFTAMIGGIDALIRGQCQKSFYQELRITQENRDNITMDGMFE